MNTSQTSFLYEIERGETIPLGKLAYLRERTRNLLYDFIIGKFLEAEKKGLSQAELARRIGKRPEVVNRWLGSPGNWRIDTISDLLVGIDADELDPQSISLLGRVPRNQTLPAWFLELQAQTNFHQSLDARHMLGVKSEPETDSMHRPSAPLQASGLLS